MFLLLLRASRIPARPKLAVQPAIGDPLLGLFHFSRSLLLEKERVFLHQRVSIAIGAVLARELGTVVMRGLELSDRL